VQAPHRDQVPGAGAAAHEGDGPGLEVGAGQAVHASPPVPGRGAAETCTWPSTTSTSNTAIGSFSPPPESSTAPVSRSQLCLYMGEERVGTSRPSVSPSTVSRWVPTRPRERMFERE